MSGVEYQPKVMLHIRGALFRNMIKGRLVKKKGDAQVTQHGVGTE